MNEIIITDEQIVDFYVGRAEDEEGTIIYREKGVTRRIMLRECAENYRVTHAQSSRCVAERNILDYTMTFFTTGSLTVIRFKKKYYPDIFGKKLLRGTRTVRFRLLLELIKHCGYTTYDLS